MADILQSVDRPILASERPVLMYGVEPKGATSVLHGPVPAIEIVSPPGDFAKLWEATDPKRVAAAVGRGVTQEGACAIAQSTELVFVRVGPLSDGRVATNVEFSIGSVPNVDASKGNVVIGVGHKFAENPNPFLRLTQPIVDTPDTAVSAEHARFKLAFDGAKSHLLVRDAAGGSTNGTFVAGGVDNQGNRVNGRVGDKKWTELLPGAVVGLGNQFPTQAGAGQLHGGTKLVYSGIVSDLNDPRFGMARMSVIST